MKAVLFSLLLLFTQTNLGWAQTLGHGYDFENNGKLEKAEQFLSVYNKINSPIKVLQISKMPSGVLDAQRKYLRNHLDKSININGLNIKNSALLNVVSTLKANSLSDSLVLNDIFNLYQIKGEDGLGNVHFTGYFVPIIKVKSEPDSIFRFPLYERPLLPSSKMPSRKEIDFENALSNQGLELAYSSSPLGNYFMQVQGSGMVEYPDGKQELLSYGGTNSKSYASIGKYLVTTGQILSEKISLESIRSYFDENPDSTKSVLSKNRSYTFFVKNQAEPVGAANVSLSKEYSIAVDPKFIPLGSVLLAKIPVLNENDVLIRHKYQLLFAQDTGGAIKGGGHVDLYFGIGTKAENKASAMHHYGELWLILPKP